MCEESNNHQCFCPLKGIIDLIGKKWVLLTVNAIGNHDRLRFNQLMEELKGISPKTLADTLKALHREGLVGREAFAEIPPRVEYFLTDDGLQLRKAVIPLLQWASTRSNGGGRKCVAMYREMPAHIVREKIKEHK